MNNAVATMTSIQDKVKERIQSTFTDLIPTEMWEGMVAQHIKDFTENQLPKIIQDEAEKRIRVLISEEFKKPEWAERWLPNGSGATSTSTMMQEVSKQVAPDLVAAMFGTMSQNIVANIRNTRY